MRPSNRFERLLSGSVLSSVSLNNRLLMQRQARARERSARTQSSSEPGRDFGHFLQFRINSYHLYEYNYEFREFGCM